MPKATIDENKRLGLLSSDCSQIMSHLIRQNIKRTDLQAKNILLSILGDGINSNLRGSKVGWYNLKFPPNSLDIQNMKLRKARPTRSICFTESTLSGIKAHRDIFCVKYGIAFSREYLMTKGINPCINIRSDLFKSEIITSDGTRHLYNFIPHPLTYLVNIINNQFDSTHEREWRIKDDLKFEISGVKFIFCPEIDFPIFSRFCTNSRPTLFDLAWLNEI